MKVRSAFAATVAVVVLLVFSQRATAETVVIMSHESGLVITASGDGSFDRGHGVFDSFVIDITGGGIDDTGVVFLSGTAVDPRTKDSLAIAVSSNPVTGLTEIALYEPNGPIGRPRFIDAVVRVLP